MKLKEIKGVQINIQSIDNIFEHISPEFELIKTVEMKNYLCDVYVNDKAKRYIGEIKNE